MAKSQPEFSNIAWLKKIQARSADDLPLDTDEQQTLDGRKLDLSSQGESPQIYPTETGQDNHQADDNPNYGMGDSGEKKVKKMDKTAQEKSVDDKITDILTRFGSKDETGLFNLDGMRIGKPQNGTWEWNGETVGNADLLHVLEPYLETRQAQLVDAPTPGPNAQLTDYSKLVMPWNQEDNKDIPFVTRPLEDFSNFKKYVRLWKKYNGKDPSQYVGNKEYLQFIALKNVFGSPNQQSVYHDAYPKDVIRNANAEDALKSSEKIVNDFRRLIADDKTREKTRRERAIEAAIDAVQGKKQFDLGALQSMAQSMGISGRGDKDEILESMERHLKSLK